jgi:methionyl-tRNA formyltransferase
MTSSSQPTVAFAGTPEFAVPSLDALASIGANVSLVLTQPDRPAGRGRKLTASPVKQAALARGYAVDQPVALDDAGRMPGWGEPPDLMLVVAYGLLLPDWLLAWPRRGCINLHASLLPRWRGAAPIQHAILAGDAETGVSIMQMERGLDTGPVFAMRSTHIGARETAGQLHDRLAELGRGLLEESLPAILAGELVAVPQDGAAASYAGKLSKRDAPLDWRCSAVELERRVRAFNPWPVAETVLQDGRRLRIWAARARENDSGGEPPGTVIDGGSCGIVVATGSGSLCLETVQAPGGKAMPADRFLQANSLTGQSFAVG